DAHPDKIEEVRGRGLLIGLKLRSGYVNKQLAARARDHHLLIGAAGDNVARLAPPLIITEDHARTAVEALDRALGALDREAAA
ncbi:MAG: aminotransferase class III-fold pyridoxal phosphate-dependent enzyme, partial [Oceanicaulis sp.]